MPEASSQSGATVLETRGQKRSDRELFSCGNSHPPSATPDRTPVHANATRVCCGNLIEPHLTEVRDDAGQIILAAIWRCTFCGRITW